MYYVIISRYGTIMYESISLVVLLNPSEINDSIVYLTKHHSSLLILIDYSY